MGPFWVCDHFHPNRSELFPIVSHRKLIICQLLVKHAKNSNGVKNSLCIISSDGSTSSFIAWISGIHRLRMSVRGEYGRILIRALVLERAVIYK